jgi:hypothetical protein
MGNFLSPVASILSGAPREPRGECKKSDFGNRTEFKHSMSGIELYALVDSPETASQSAGFAGIAPKLMAK